MVYRLGGFKLASWLHKMAALTGITSTSAFDFFFIIIIFLCRFSFPTHISLDVDVSCTNQQD